MKVFRLCRAAFPAIDGEGARLHGGRWSSPGRRIVYTSQTLALASLEMLVHIDPSLAPPDLIALTIEIPDELAVEFVKTQILPPDWQNYSDTTPCRAVGDAWADSNAAAILRVPAAPVPSEFNFLLNAAHTEMGRIRVVDRQPFTFDTRLLK